jgi:DNA gyrase inhibitor GyrI
MSELEVRIVKLEPIRVASFHAFSATPEHDAIRKLIAWAQPKGMLNGTARQRIFGFNNPDPSPGSPNYGYEFWITVGPDVQPGEGLTIKEFPGGLYAVTRCEVKDPYKDIPGTWERLATWCEDSKYHMARHQWLEEHLAPYPIAVTEEFTLDLYLPIAA